MRTGFRHAGLIFVSLAVVLVIIGKDVNLIIVTLLFGAVLFQHVAALSAYFATVLYHPVPYS